MNADRVPDQSLFEPRCKPHFLQSEILCPCAEIASRINKLASQTAILPSAVVPTPYATVCRLPVLMRGIPPLIA